MTNTHTHAQNKITGHCAGDCYPCMPCANISAKQREAARRQFGQTRDRGRAYQPLQRVAAAAAPNAGVPNVTRNSCLSVVAAHRRLALGNSLAFCSVSAQPRDGPNLLLRRKRTRSTRLQCGWCNAERGWLFSFTTDIVCLVFSEQFLQQGCKTLKDSKYLFLSHYLTTRQQYRANSRERVHVNLNGQLHLTQFNEH